MNTLYLPIPKSSIAHAVDDPSQVTRYVLWVIYYNENDFVFHLLRVEFLEPPFDKQSKNMNNSKQVQY